MKLTKSNLKRLIKEELQTVLQEQAQFPAQTPADGYGKRTYRSYWEWLNTRLATMENNIKQLIAASCAPDSSPPPASPATPQDQP